MESDIFCGSKALSEQEMPFFDEGHLSLFVLLCLMKSARGFNPEKWKYHVHLVLSATRDLKLYLMVCCVGIQQQSLQNTYNLRAVQSYLKDIIYVFLLLVRTRI